MGCSTVRRPVLLSILLFALAAVAADPTASALVLVQKGTLPVIVSAPHA